MPDSPIPVVMPRLQPQYLPIREAGGFWAGTRAWMRSRRQWQLAEDWHYQLPDRTPVVIPAGFVTDGASAPRPFWPFMPPVGPLLIPSLIHDFAYCYDYLWTTDGANSYRKHREGAGRDYWDSLFHEIGLRLVGRNLFTAPAYQVIRFTGRKAWRDKRRQHCPELRPGSLAD